MRGRERTQTDEKVPLGPATAGNAFDAFSTVYR